MKSFAKHTNCPASHEILSYVEGSLRPFASQRIAQHCMLCDFCGAEAELFAKFRPSEEHHAPARTPVLITVLGVNLPIRKTAPVERRHAA